MSIFAWFFLARAAHCVAMVMMRSSIDPLRLMRAVEGEPPQVLDDFADPFGAFQRAFDQRLEVGEDGVDPVFAT